CTPADAPDPHVRGGALPLRRRFRSGWGPARARAGATLPVVEALEGECRIGPGLVVGGERAAPCCKNSDGGDPPWWDGRIPHPFRGTASVRGVLGRGRRVRGP